MTPMPSAIAKAESSMSGPRFASLAACLGCMIVACTILTWTALAVRARSFTTAAEVKPILSATKPQRIAVQGYDVRDLLYFANLLVWRCGVETVAFGVNGAAPETVLRMETCHEAKAQPNALKDEDIVPYVTTSARSRP
jgi:hypothetical protein